MAPLQGIVAMDGSNVSSAAAPMQVFYFVFLFTSMVEVNILSSTSF